MSPRRRLIAGATITTRVSTVAIRKPRLIGRVTNTVRSPLLAHTANLYQPGTRRPYGVLEWPAMLRRLAAEQTRSDYPPYWA